jgi:hypothetical protein
MKVDDKPFLLNIYEKFIFSMCVYKYICEKVDNNLS